MDIQEKALYVQEQLLDGGFIVQRYDSYTTNSIYMKLDYGVMNSIRISDHKGKKHLKYRYNLLENRKQVNRHTNDISPRNFYGFQHVEDMLLDIYRDKLDRLNRYGAENYARYMQKNVIKNIGNLGFWAKCTELV